MGQPDAGPERQRYTDLMMECLLAGAKVLELGCGAGVPTTLALSRRFEVTGIDLSAHQIALARRNVPRATFVQADMTRFSCAPASLDAVVAFYSIIHLPREEHPAPLSAIAMWLKPGGLLVATMGSTDVAAQSSPDWSGAPMYWSHFDSVTNRRLLEEAGFQISNAQEGRERQRKMAFLSPSCGSSRANLSAESLHSILHIISR